MKNRMFAIQRFQITLATLFGISAVLTVSPAFAQLASAPISSLTTDMSTRQHPPMDLHEVLSDGSVTSHNWSGFAVTGSEFTSAKGSWHVPEVDCTKTPNTYSAFWVGIDGYSDKTVEQTGTGSDCAGTTPQYYAWYEFYPANSVVITSMPVKAGDVMGASITFASGEFTLSIHDRTSGAEFHITKALSGAKRTSAEWIAEAPCCTSGGGILPLADYDVGNFGENHTGDTGTDYATDSSVDNKPISDFGSAVEKITMVRTTGVVKSEPSNLSSNGTSFQTFWKDE